MKFYGPLFLIFYFLLYCIVAKLPDLASASLKMFQTFQMSRGGNQMHLKVRVLFSCHIKKINESTCSKQMYIPSQGILNSNSPRLNKNWHKFYLFIISILFFSIPREKENVSRILLREFNWLYSSTEEVPIVP